MKRWTLQASGLDMADQETAGENGEENGDEAKGKKGKLIIIIGAVALLLLVGGGGGAAYFLGLFGGDSAPAEAEADPGDDETQSAEGDGDHSKDDPEAQEAAANADVAPGDLVFVDLPDILVNLQSTGKRMRFLKMRVALEASDSLIANQIKKLMPRIMDSFQMYLRALTIDEVSNPASLHRLKEELTARTNYAISPNRIDDVLVKELLVQ